MKMRSDCPVSYALDFFGDKWTFLIVRDMVFEEFAFDRLQDERGAWIKDISHEGCRYLTRDEVLRVLRAHIPVEQRDGGRYGRTGGGR